MNTSEREKAKIRYELSRVRRDLSGGVDSLGETLNVKERLRTSFNRQAGQWLIGGLVAGAVISLLIPGGKNRDSRRSPQRSLVLGLLGIASKQIIQLSLPLITRQLGKGLAQWAETHQPENSQHSNSHV